MITSDDSGNSPSTRLRDYLSPPPGVDFRFYRAYLFSCLLGLTFHIVFLMLFWSVGVVPMALFNILSIAIWVTTIWLVRRGYVLLSYLCLASEVTVHAILSVYFVGGDVGFQYFLITLSMVSLILPGYRRQTTFLAILLAVLFIALSFYDQWHTPPYILNTWITASLFIGNLTGAVLVMALTLAYYMGVVERTEAALAAEHVKSEALLHNVLPVVIAERLKQDRGTIAERFERVSVLFADVCNFTGLSAECDPVELLDALNEVFNYFDTIIEKHGLEKIRTIGDNYMVASGAPIPRPDYAQALARAAIEMMDYPQHCPTALAQALQFRAGINCGPVVGGVIGHTKFHYDVWGDPVNVAARMESHGIPGKIQITNEFYQLIHEEFVCEGRGRIEVKGKGEMETWFLLGIR